MEYIKINAFIEAWFPKSNVTREISIKEKATRYLKNIIGKEPYLRLTKIELRDYLIPIRKWYNSDLQSPNPILHLVDENFNCIPVGAKYILFYGQEYPRTKKFL